MSGSFYNIFPDNYWPPPVFSTPINALSFSQLIQIENWGHFRFSFSFIPTPFQTMGKSYNIGDLLIQHFSVPNRH